MTYGYLWSTLEEGQALSSYRSESIGLIHFKRDADAQHPSVMLASIVGKYVRELFMRRIGHYYLNQLPKSSDLALPSGYHDPVTQQFVVHTESLRKKLNAPDDCFVRDKAEQKRAPKRKPGQKKKAPKKPQMPEGQGSLF